MPVAGYIALKNEENTKGLENFAGFLLILTAAALVSFYFILKNNFRKAAISSFLFYTLFHLVFFNWLYPAVYNQNPLTKTIESVKKYDKVVAYQIFHPSFTYYLPERVQVFKNLDSLRTYLSQNEAAVISRKNFSEELKSIQLKELYSIHDLFEGNTTVIYAKPF